SDTFLRLFTQPLADLRLIGELADTEQFQSQRIIIQSLAVGQATPAGAQRVNQLADDDLRAIATLLVLAGIQAGKLAHLFPEPEPARHRFHRDQPGMNGLVSVSDELQLQPSLSFVNRRHWLSF